MSTRNGFDVSGPFIIHQYLQYPESYDPHNTRTILIWIELKISEVSSIRRNGLFLEEQRIYTKR